MSGVSEQYVDNYNALSKTTKGAAPQVQVMWGAIAITIFECLESWVTKQPPRGRAVESVRQADV